MLFQNVERDNRQHVGVRSLEHNRCRRAGAVGEQPNQASYTYGEVVTLTATADPGWQFVNWSGDLSGSTNPDTVTITGDTVVVGANFADQAGIRVIAIEEFFQRGVDSVMDEARTIAGDGRTYVSYDIDFVDPAFAPGTGTPEIGGPNAFQAQQVIRELQGINLVGADLVEVSPPFDLGGGTAWLGASILFEMLCVMADAI